MYDLPELQAATDAWWDGLAQAFRREGLSNIPVGSAGGTIRRGMA